MYSFNCVIQEGVIPDGLRPNLVSELGRIITSILGGSPDDVDVEFTVIPHGYGFRGGELSTTSLVRGYIPAGMRAGDRVCSSCSRSATCGASITGCSVDELVVSARDRE